MKRFCLFVFKIKYLKKLRFDLEIDATIVKIRPRSCYINHFLCYSLSSSQFSMRVKRDHEGKRNDNENKLHFLPLHRNNGISQVGRKPALDIVSRPW